MARPKQGETARGRTFYENGSWRARIRLNEKHRPFFELPFKSKSQEQNAKDRTAVLAAIASRLRKTVPIDTALALLNKAAAADAKTLGDVQRVVDGVCAGDWTAPSKLDETTFEQVANDWTGGRLAARYPDHVRLKRTVRDDVQRMRDYILPIIGAVPIAKFTVEDAERVMRAIPTDFTANTRRNFAVLIHRLLALAVFPLRLRESNPLPTGWLPKPGRRKAKSYLYPDEDRALLAATAIPFRRRFAYGFLAREGNRKSEGVAMVFDLKRGAVVLDINKTDDPRSWALDAGVATALRKVEEIFGAAEISAIMTEMAELRGDQLRDDLKAIGIDRRELFEKSGQRDPVTVHSLRATFVTLALAAGRSEAWVSDRTGHKSSHMIHHYKRAARSVAELGLGELTPLDHALPELARRTDAGNGLENGLCNGLPPEPTTPTSLPNPKPIRYIQPRKRLAGWCRPRSSKPMWGS